MSERWSGWIGLLGNLSRVWSVSGGSITAGTPALARSELVFKSWAATNLDIFVVRVRATAATTVDMGAVIGGILLPGPVSDRVVTAYDKVLFKGKKLSDLVSEEPGVPWRCLYLARVLFVLRRPYRRRMPWLSCDFETRMDGMVRNL